MHVVNSCTNDIHHTENNKQSQNANYHLTESCLLLHDLLLVIGLLLQKDLLDDLTFNVVLLSSRKAVSNSS